MVPMKKTYAAIRKPKAKNNYYEIKWVGGHTWEPGRLCNMVEMQASDVNWRQSGIGPNGTNDEPFIQTQTFNSRLLPWRCVESERINEICLIPGHWGIKKAYAHAELKGVGPRELTRHLWTCSGWKWHSFAIWCSVSAQEHLQISF